MSSRYRVWFEFESVVNLWLARTKIRGESAVIWKETGLWEAILRYYVNKLAADGRNESTFAIKRDSDETRLAPTHWLTSRYERTHRSNITI